MAGEAKGRVHRSNRIRAGHDDWDVCRWRVSIGPTHVLGNSKDTASVIDMREEVNEHCENARNRWGAPWRSRRLSLSLSVSGLLRLSLFLFFSSCSVPFRLFVRAFFLSFFLSLLFVFSSCCFLRV